MAAGYILVGSITLSCLLFCTSFGSDVSRDKRFDQNVFFTYSKIQSYLVCGMLCVQSSRCEAFNFKVDNSTCFLIDQLVTSTVVSEAGYLSSNITNWNPTISGSCETKPCDVSSFCVPGTSSFNCVTAGWAVM